MKKVVHFLVCAAFAYTSQASAVFCTAQEYIHPTTGKSVWLFGDVHCDVDTEFTMTRLHQHALLEAAEKIDATIIAENVDRKLYSPYPWILRFGLDAAIFYKAFKDNSYKWFLAGSFLTSLHVAGWNADQRKTQRPAINLTDHIAHLKKNSTVITLPCYLASPLFSLVQEAQKRGIPAVDLEFRYHAEAAYTRTHFAQLAPFLQALCAKIDDTKRCIYRRVTGNDIRYQLTLRDYCRVNDAILAEIEAYNAEPIERDFYQQCIESYRTSYMTMALRDLPQEMGLADIMPTLLERTGKDMATALQDVAEHNMTLLDARLIHTIVSHKDDNVFVCTGAYHVHQITKLLMQLGYLAEAKYGENNLKMLQDTGAIGRTFIHLNDLDYFAVDLDMIFAQI